VPHLLASEEAIPTSSETLLCQARTGFFKKGFFTTLASAGE